VQHVFDLTPLLINAVEDAGFKERVPHVTDMILVIAAKFTFSWSDLKKLICVCSLSLDLKGTV
jgi:antitoxin component HigA of HigAB toxin-antitoxin module